MKMFITIMTIIITLQYASGQSNQTHDSYFDNASFVRAKINNEDASKFFLNYPYNSTISGSDGNVLVSFIVRKDGQIDSVQVLNNPGI
jgi:outer membrane biosynthesis protein TonB